MNNKGPMIYHDNALSQSSRLTVKFLEGKHKKVLEQQPYFRNLTTCYLRLFLKENKIGGTRFSF